MKENRQNNNFNYNDWAKDNNQWHFHIGKTGLIIICIVAFIAIFGSGVFDTDEPSETTASTTKQTTVSNPITEISFAYSEETEIELDPDDFEYVYFRFNTSRYTFDDIQLISTNPDVCKLELDDEKPSSTLDCKISSFSAGESVVYIQTSDGKVKSPEIKVTVLPITIDRINFDQGINGTLNMLIGETVEDTFSVSANADITLEHITLVNSNPDIVQFEYIDSENRLFYTYIKYKIHALSEGTCVLYVKSADGDIRSEEIQIIITSESETIRPKPPIETTDKPIETTESEYTYVLNTNTMVFHYSSCRYADKISSANKSTFTGTRSEIIRKGYDSCGHCDP